MPRVNKALMMFFFADNASNQSNNSTLVKKKSLGKFLFHLLGYNEHSGQAKFDRYKWLCYNRVDFLN